MANPGHIIVKKGKGDYNIRKKFFRPVDGKSAKPAFCYPKRTETLRAEVRGMQRSLDGGFVAPERRMAYEQTLKQRKKKLETIEDSFTNAKRVIDSDKDGWSKRRDKLATAIAEQTPTRKEYAERRVNPHTILRQEKQGLKGCLPLEGIKREYTIISRALQAAGEEAESDHSFLQKEK
jgi:hypothetical protein